MNETTDQFVGPECYANWRAARSGCPLVASYEVALVTDARITGEITFGFGPYEFLNPVPMPDMAGAVRPSIYLRYDFHIPATRPDMTRTSTKYFHGGHLDDEVAALCSLAMGIRCKSAGVTRRFSPTGDPKGQPIEYRRHAVPARVVNGNAMLPGVAGSSELDRLRVFDSLPAANPDQCISLIRAARLYQDALWIAESEPALAWVMFVSSLEGAANAWRKEKGSAIERLKDAKPDLVSEIEKKAGTDLAINVAESISDSLGVSKKFKDFVLEFLPEAPRQRPAKAFQVDWNEESMRKALGHIYRYRSKALHEGIPFPSPMCEAPFRHSESELPTEKPMGLATSTKNAVWKIDDTPMVLNTFEYIARNVLLRWWESSVGNVA